MAKTQIGQEESERPQTLGEVARILAAGVIRQRLKPDVVVNSRSDEKLDEKALDVSPETVLSVHTS